ncbi:MAG: hypothetical protein M1564_01575 [Candidatus Marsarchaeota archaeon]|jgi:hypothetical protein|nr:hypothetical protein [Candidatus Marsarchaeota archaeon]MCL5430969.1 hypothetical protein [Candidatus Marsarchaeota archaeon]
MASKRGEMNAALSVQERLAGLASRNKELRGEMELAQKRLREAVQSVPHTKITAQA